MGLKGYKACGCEPGLKREGLGAYRVQVLGSGDSAVYWGVTQDRDSNCIGRDSNRLQKVPG